MHAYREFLNNKLTTLNHISSTHSTFIINELKDTFAIHL
jgi:Lrp/AsnC family leucine-responsive transcriptional regulator